MHLTLTNNSCPPGRLLLTLLALGIGAAPACAFVPAGTTPANSRWQSTASGPTGVPGDPITLTWSFVPDGTLLFDSDSISLLPSDLLSRLDTELGLGPGGADLTQRPWFRFFEDSFNRWAELAGVTFLYEPNDDGVQHGSQDGVLGVRGDMRVGGAGFDGDGGTLAYNYFPADGGDTALDTDDFIDLFVDPTDDYRYLRNTIMHEIGHGLGVDHTNSIDADFLMEPSINTAFDGPQHDDLRGIQWFYGDAREQGPGGRNETAATATPLGALLPGGTLSVGTDGSGAVIDAAETDFVSITNENDFDFFSFTALSPLTLEAVMTPRGATYLQTNTEFDTTTTSDLSLAIFDSDGVTLIGEASAAPAGSSEVLGDIEIDTPGDYYARVRGPLLAADQVVQFYQLSLTATPFELPLPGDFNGDGVVDIADYTTWRDVLDEVVTPLTSADHSGNGIVDAADYTIWVNNFGQILGGGALAVPEPTGAATLALLGAIAAASSGPRRC